MFTANLKEINVGDIVPITMYGSVHNIGFVDKVSGGIIKMHTLIGQYDLAFAQDYGSEGNTAEEKRRSSLSPEKLNGPFAKNFNIGITTELPDRIIKALKDLDGDLKNKSGFQTKIILEKNSDLISEAKGIFKTSVLEPQIELPGLRF